jgi:hypothetical protein
MTTNNESNNYPNNVILPNELFDTFVSGFLLSDNTILCASFVRLIVSLLLYIFLKKSIHSDSHFESKIIFNGLFIHLFDTRKNALICSKQSDFNI